MGNMDSFDGIRRAESHRASFGMDRGLKVVEVGQRREVVSGEAESACLIVAELGIRKDGLQRMPEVFLRDVGLSRDSREEAVQGGEG